MERVVEPYNDYVVRRPWLGFLLRAVLAYTFFHLIMLFTNVAASFLYKADEDPIKNSPVNKDKSVTVPKNVYCKEQADSAPIKKNVLHDAPKDTVALDTLYKLWSKNMVILLHDRGDIQNYYVFGFGIFVQMDLVLVPRHFVERWREMPDTDKVVIQMSANDKAIIMSKAEILSSVKATLDYVDLAMIRVPVGDLSGMRPNILNKFPPTHSDLQISGAT